MANFCSNCGEKLKEGAKFCSGCGKFISDGVEKSVTENTDESTTESTRQKIGKKLDEKLDKLGENISNNYWNPKDHFEEGDHVKDQGFLEHFFKKDGRLNRKPFILRLITIEITRFIVMALAFYFLSDNYSNTTDSVSYLLVLIAGIFIYSNYCINVRRQQDILSSVVTVQKTSNNKEEKDDNEEEKDDRFFLSKLIAFVDGMSTLLALSNHRPTGYAAIYAEFEPLIIIAIAIAQLYLVFKKGIDGPNQYGPNPLDFK